MENREDNLEQWVGERLASLRAPSDWRPDDARAYAGLRSFEQRRKRQWRRRVVVAAAFAVICLAALLVQAPKAYCAGPGCKNDSPVHQPVAPAPVPAR